MYDDLSKHYDNTAVSSSVNDDYDNSQGSSKLLLKNSMDLMRDNHINRKSSNINYLEFYKQNKFLIDFIF